MCASNRSTRRATATTCGPRCRGRTRRCGTTCPTARSANEPGSIPGWPATPAAATRCSTRYSTTAAAKPWAYSVTCASPRRMAASRSAMSLSARPCSAHRELPRRFICSPGTPSMTSATAAWNGNAMPPTHARCAQPSASVSVPKGCSANIWCARAAIATPPGSPLSTATGRQYATVFSAGWRQITSTPMGSRNSAWRSCGNRPAAYSISNRPLRICAPLRR